MDARLAHAGQLLDGLIAVKGARTVVNTLRPFDDVQSTTFSAVRSISNHGSSG